MSPGEGEWGVTANEYKVSFCGAENALQLVLIVAQLCECIKNHETVHFKE